MDQPADTLGHVTITYRDDTVVAKDSTTGISTVGDTKPDALRSLARALAVEEDSFYPEELSSLRESNFSDELL